MSRWHDFWFGKEERAEEPITPPISDALLKALVNNEVITREKAMTLPAVSGAVNFIADMIASMPVRLYRFSNGKVTERANDPRVKLLNGDTGDTLDAYQMKKAVVMDYLMGKGGYIYIERNRNDVVSLRYVEEIYISVLKNFKPIFKDYKILVEGVEYNPWDFIKLLRNTQDGASGEGLTKEVSKALETAYQTLLYQLMLAKTGGNKKGFLKSQKRLGEDELAVLKTAWKNMYSGDSSENVVVLNNGLEFQEASQSSVDMQLDQNKKTLSDEINSIFHIYPDDFYKTFKMAIYPIIKAFETALNRDLLLEKEKKNHYFAFDVKEILKVDIAERYQAYKIAKETGFMTLNEIRKAENMSWVEGLDVVNVGLGAVLYDTNEHKYFTPNTGETTDISETQQEEDKMLEDHELAEEYDESGNSADRNLRFNPNHSAKDGKFISKSLSTVAFTDKDRQALKRAEEKYGEPIFDTMKNIEDSKEAVRVATLYVKSKASNEVNPFEKKEADIEKVKERGDLTDEEARDTIAFAESLYDKASKVEPQITADVVSSVEDAGGTMYGLDFRMKQPTSMAGKIGSDAKDNGTTFEQEANGIKDAVRYTALFDDDNLVSGYQQVKTTMESNGYKEVRMKNFYKTYDEGTSDQRALQAVYENSDGYKFEFQFHTPTSQGAKELNHPLYEEQRNKTTSPQRASELSQQMRAYGESVHVPKGVMEVETHK